MLKNQKKKTPVVQQQKEKQKKSVIQKESLIKILQPLLFILPIVFIAFYPVLNNELTNWDDPDLIIDNPLIRTLSWENIKKIFTTFYFGNYQPLHLVSYSIEYHFWGLNPVGYHAVSLGMFLITTCLVYYFIYQISNQNKTIAIIATLLFAVNGMRVESVAWAAERKDTLYSLFYVAALIGYTNYIKNWKDGTNAMKIKYLVYAFLFFTLSIFSKVMAVSIVGAYIMLDYFYERKFSMRMVYEKIPFVLLSIAVGLTQVKATSSSGSIDTSDQFNHLDRVLIVCRNLMYYFYKMLMPVNLSAFYPYPPKAENIPWPTEFFIAPFFVLIMLGLVIWSVRNTRVVLFAAGFFVSALALVLQYVAVGPAMFNERYALIPAISLSFLIAYGVYYFITKYPTLKTVGFGITGVYLLMMFYLTFTRCDVWQTSLTLWDDVLKQFPNVSTALNNRGKYYGKDLGNTAKAMEDLTASIKFDPNYEKAYSNRGIVYCIKGQFDSAVVDFNNAIRLKPDYYEAITNRAIAYAQMKRPDMALKDFSTSIEMEPGKADTYLNRGICYTQLNQPEKALMDFNTGMSLNPEKPDFYLRRSQAYYNLRKYNEAFNDVQIAKNAGMKVDDAYFNQIKAAAGK